LELIMEELPLAWGEWKKTNNTKRMITYYE
jgi:hypothetical protein